MNEVEINKSVFKKTTLFKYLIDIKKEDKNDVYDKLNNKCSNSQDILTTLDSYLSFLKYYNSHLDYVNYHLLYVYDYFLNLIDCIVYENYFGIIEFPIKKYIEKELVELSEKDDDMEENLRKLLGVFIRLENNKELNENLYMMKLLPEIKNIYKNVDRK